MLQLTADLNERGAELDLRWRPREENEAADRLSNGITEGFDPGLHRRFDVRKLETLNRVLKDGRAMCYLKVQEEKARRKELAKEEALRERKRPARKPEDRLRNRDPWA